MSLPMGTWTKVSGEASWAKILSDQDAASLGEMQENQPSLTSSGGKLGNRVREVISSMYQCHLSFRQNHEPGRKLVLCGCRLPESVCGAITNTIRADRN